MSLSALAFEQGVPELAPHPWLYGRVRLYAPVERAATAVEAVDRAMGAVCSIFEEAKLELHARIQSGRTKGYSFVYLVLPHRGAAADQEAIVAAITITPADVVASSPVEVCADVSGEETGTWHFGPQRQQTSVDGLYDAASRAANDLLGWLRDQAATGPR